jgi:hypothetical protein
LVFFIDEEEEILINSNIDNEPDLPTASLPVVYLPEL